ncbi:MAG TPA: ribbon-helix-helix domain-containing protein [Actinomycetota bacterium]|nr:ribbon-helix-helix domain-containing protein [Actinomycetota bacterium]
MATVKVTVTLPEEQLRSIRELVTAGRARNVSAFVQHAVGLALDDVAGWQEILSQGLAQSGGPLTEEERRWADRILGDAGASTAA